MHKFTLAQEYFYTYEYKKYLIINILKKILFTYH